MKPITKKSRWLAERKIVTLMLDIDGDETLEYRGYLGSVEYSVEDQCYHGKIYDIEDLVSYEGNTIEELMADFRNAVDDYEKEKRNNAKN